MKRGRTSAALMGSMILSWFDLTTSTWWRESIASTSTTLLKMAASSQQPTQFASPAGGHTAGSQYLLGCACSRRSHSKVALPDTNSNHQHSAVVLSSWWKRQHGGDSFFSRRRGGKRSDIMNNNRAAFLCSARGGMIIRSHQQSSLLLSSRSLGPSIATVSRRPCNPYNYSEGTLASPQRGLPVNAVGTSLHTSTSGTRRRKRGYLTATAGGAVQDGGGGLGLTNDEGTADGGGGEYARLEVPRWRYKAVIIPG